jgi:hypothetical protein
MAGKRVLFVCFEPSSLLRHEHVITSHGYEVHTVLGLDGLMATNNLPDFTFILIGDEGPLAARQKSVHWLKEELTPVPIIMLCRGTERFPEADYQVSASDPDCWFDIVSQQDRQNLA